VGLRVLLAYDGSGPAETALELVASTTWPGDTRVFVLGAHDEHLPFLGTGEREDHGGAETARGTERNSDAQAEVAREMGREALAAAASRIAAGGIEVGWDLVDGDPLSVLIAEVGRLDANLVVTGARGPSTLADEVATSFTQALFEAAPCPVLAVRRPELRPMGLVVETYGLSGPAAAVLTQLPLPRDSVLPVIAVATPDTPLTTELAAPVLDEARREQDLAEQEAMARLDAHLEAVAGALEPAGVVPRVDATAGDTATIAAEWAAANGVQTVVAGMARRLVAEPPLAVDWQQGNDLAANLLRTADTNVLGIPVDRGAEIQHHGQGRDGAGH
jgi:nucleotide-binding universal stress UspA family protein